MREALPYNQEAELAVIGSVYLDPTLYPEIANMLSSDDFYNRKHREIWKAESECVLEGQLDLVTLAAKLKERGVLEQCGGVQQIVDAVNWTPTSVGALKYAQIVLECGNRRRLMRNYRDAYTLLSDLGRPIEEVNAFVQQVIAMPASEEKKTLTFNEAFHVFEKNYRDREKRGVTLPGISTGYPVLDDSIGGLEKGKLYIIGGRPGMGKTAFALNMAYKLARNGNKVAFFSLEMGKEEVVKRIVSFGAGIDGSRIKRAELNEKEWDQVKNVRKNLGENLIVDDECSQTVPEIMSKCLAINAELQSAGKKLACVMIDYLQLLQGTTKTADRRVQIGEISRAGKLLAKRLQCPVLIPSQLSRALKDRGGNRPVLTDLRESGDIEQDADVVILLHRPDYYGNAEDQQRPEQLAEVIVAKNRDGYTGSIYYTWQGNQTKFTERPWQQQKPREV